MLNVGGLEGYGRLSLDEGGERWDFDLRVNVDFRVNVGYFLFEFRFLGFIY